MDGTDASIASTSGEAKSSESALETPTKSPGVVKATPAKKSKSKAKKKATAAPPTPTSAAKTPVATPEPDKGLIETREEMHARLKNGIDFTTDAIKGVRLANSVSNPIISKKTVTYPEDQIQKLLSEVHEIKYLLFCRFLLGHAALLPAALRANSVEEFITDPEVSTAALRDLCLKMENPGLQEVRDACADLFRSEGDEVEADIEMAEPEPNDKKNGRANDKNLLKPYKRKGDLPDSWKPKREIAKQAQDMAMMPTIDSLTGLGEGGAINFGESKDIKKEYQKKIRVKICGRSIWNYPSNKAMNRGGWLHFCIIAKDSSLHDAVALCRHWDEFFELNILAIWHYFPGKNWSEWVGNQYRQQMLQLVSCVASV